MCLSLFASPALASDSTNHPPAETNNREAEPPASPSPKKPAPPVFPNDIRVERDVAFLPEGRQARADLYL